jgi:hypothetical protein
LLQPAPVRPPVITIHACQDGVALRTSAEARDGGIGQQAVSQLQQHEQHEPQARPHAYLKEQRQCRSDRNELLGFLKLVC